MIAALVQRLMWLLSRSGTLWSLTLDPYAVAMELSPLQRTFHVVERQEWWGGATKPTSERYITYSHAAGKGPSGMSDRVDVGSSGYAASGAPEAELSAMLDGTPDLSGELARADALQAQAILDYLEGRSQTETPAGRRVRPAPVW